MKPPTASLATQISNQFFDGYYRDFEQAIAALITAYRNEKAIEENEQGKSFWEREISKCQKADEIYTRHMEAIKQKIIDELMAEGLEEFAEALESGDYSSFAY